MQEKVNSPEYYRGKESEVWEQMIALYGEDKFLSFCELNAYKYRMRAGKKEGQPADQDIAKAIWYETKKAELENTPRPVKEVPLYKWPAPTEEKTPSKRGRYGRFGYNPETPSAEKTPTAVEMPEGLCKYSAAQIRAIKNKYGDLRRNAVYTESAGYVLSLPGAKLTFRLPLRLHTPAIAEYCLSLYGCEIVSGEPCLTQMAVQELTKIAKEHDADIEQIDQY